MKTQQQTPTQPLNQVQGLVTDGKLVLSKDGRYLTFSFPDGSKLREHRNRFLSILGESFVPEAKKELNDGPQTLATGFIAKTRIVLSRDQNYVTVYFPGGRFVRHVNAIRSILDLKIKPVSKSYA